MVIVTAVLTVIMGIEEVTLLIAATVTAVLSVIVVMQLLVIVISNYSAEFSHIEIKVSQEKHM